MSLVSLPPFTRDAADPDVTRMGSGEAGGKAVGLATIEQRILAAIDRTGIEDILFVVPRAVVLATGIFDAFIRHNKLAALAAETDDEQSEERADARVEQAFLRAELPALVVGDLRSLIEVFREPLAVRSSSLLEDALEHPFAGVYGTKMIPNTSSSLDVRFKELIGALKYVYATTFFRAAREYRRSLGDEAAGREEKMAVVVQRVAGRRFDSRFYPCISGVARSFNYYPTGHAEPDDGVVNLALGLGKSIVDGDRCWTYCPRYPKAPPPVGSVTALLNSGQTRFWSLDLAAKASAADAMRESEFMRQLDVSVAEGDGVLPRLVSTYDGAADRMVPGLRPRGARLLDFAPLLQLELSSLNEALRRMLMAAEQVLGVAVEIEFAASWDPSDPEPTELSLLQVRPMRISRDAVSLQEEDLEGEGLLVASESVMGNGSRELDHVLYLEPEAFDAAATRAIAAEVAEHNRALLTAGTPYLLMGFGRWGSTDPWLGVPVTWSDIAGARAVVEATLPNMNPELSQGSHFFHNMISFGVHYLCVRHGLDAPIDWAWLGAQQTVATGRYTRVVRTPRPLTLLVDGRHRRGVIRY